MKALQNLSKEELLSFIYHYPPGNINIWDELADCAVCGVIVNAKYRYICGKCCEVDSVDKDGSEK